MNPNQHEVSMARRAESLEPGAESRPLPILLTGWAAIEYADEHGLTLSKFSDPLEMARTGLSVVEARDIAREDPGLIYYAGEDVARAEPREPNPESLGEPLGEFTQ